MTKPEIEEVLVAMVWDLPEPTTSFVLEIFGKMHPGVLQSEARGAMLGLISAGRVRVGTGWSLVVVESTT